MEKFYYIYKLETEDESFCKGVVAESEERAIELLKKEYDYEYIYYLDRYDIYDLLVRMDWDYI